MAVADGGQGFCDVSLFIDIVSVCFFVRCLFIDFFGITVLCLCRDRVNIGYGWVRSRVSSALSTLRYYSTAS